VTALWMNLVASVGLMVKAWWRGASFDDDVRNPNIVYVCIAFFLIHHILKLTKLVWTNRLLCQTDLYQFPNAVKCDVWLVCCSPFWTSPMHPVACAFGTLHADADYMLIQFWRQHTLFSHILIGSLAASYSKLKIVLEYFPLTSSHRSHVVSFILCSYPDTRVLVSQAHI